MPRPKKTIEQLEYEYGDILYELSIATPQRQIAKEYKVSLSTIERLKKKFF